MSEAFHGFELIFYFGTMHLAMLTNNPRPLKKKIYISLFKLPLGVQTKRIIVIR